MYRNEIKELFIGKDSVVKGFFKWLIISLLMGATVGFIGVLFYYSSSFADKIHSNHSFTLYLMPVGGLLIVLIYKLMGISNDRGTNLVLLAVSENEKMSIKNAVSIFLASVITHFCGGSSGREGASLQIGASVGSALGRALKLSEEDKKILTMCGMSAMFSAVFGTPITASVFSMEVISVGIFRYYAIVPCVLSALTADYISDLCNTSHLHMEVAITEQTPLNFLKVILLGLACAVLSVIVCMALTGSTALFRKIRNSYARAMTGGALLILMTLISGTQIYNGTGGAMIMSFFEDRPFALAFLVKLLFTMVTLGSGFKGGEILPVFFIGASFGSTVSPLLGFDCSVGASICMTALFCGVTNCPIASIILCVELFGSDGIAFYVTACVISYMVSGYKGLYSEQVILYSKTNTEYINRKIGDKNYGGKNEKQ